MRGQVVHFEIPADDVERAADFYRSAFDWDITSVPGMNYWGLGTTPAGEDGAPLAPGAINGGMFQREGNLTTPVVTVDVDDIDAALEKVAELGGSTVLPKAEVPGMGWAAYFKDPEGNTIGLWQNLEPA